MTDCTIIIPTYNRPVYLRRLLSYYDSFGERLRIIVADSSSDENKKINKDIISSVSNLDIRYLDSYPTDINPYHKWADVVNYSQEKYCVFCADDDFVTPNGIKQSVDFLERNPDFVIAQGRFIGFRLKKDKEEKLRFRWKFASDLPLSIEFSDPVSRLECHLSKYFTSTLYAVHRSEALKKIYNEVLKSGTDPVFFGELLLSMLTLICGKMKCLAVLYGARSEETVNLNWPTLSNAIEAGIFDDKYARFRECLAKNLNQTSRLGMEESGKLVDRAFSAYLHKQMLKPIIPIPKSKKRTALESLHLPASMQNGIIASYGFSNRLATVGTKSLYNALLGKPIFALINQDDLAKIRRYVINSV